MSKTLGTILCIDDDASGLLIRKLLLEAAGYQVFTALSGAEGLEILASRGTGQGAIAAVILDYQMPGMNGGEVAVQIRQILPHLPIILLSGYIESVTLPSLAIVDAMLVKGGAPERLLALLSVMTGRSTTNLTVLNVDDRPEHRYPISRALRNAGYTVVEANNGREALTMAALKPALVILDLNLPDLLGFEVCKQLRANPVTKDIPIIHVSATFPADAAEQKSIESGANSFFEYPTDPGALVQAVTSELHKRHSARQ